MENNYNDLFKNSFFPKELPSNLNPSTETNHSSLDRNNLQTTLRIENKRLNLKEKPKKSLSQQQNYFQIRVDSGYNEYFKDKAPQTKLDFMENSKWKDFIIDKKLNKI